MRSFAYIIILLIIHSITLLAQNNNALGDLVPPTPNAAAFGKYGEYPVNYGNGSISPSVPLATLNAGTVQLPLSLSYHTAGIKVSEMASWVGLGWNLNATGVITRSVRGAPDEGDIYADGYYASGADTYVDPLDAEQKEQASKGRIDTEPDIFYYNFNGYSGKFYFNRDTQISILPRQDLRIEPVHYPNQIVSKFRWKITTPDGTKYFFGAVTQEPDWQEQFIEVTHSFTGSLNSTNDNQLVVNAWYLARIEAPNSDFAIDFDYKFEKYRYSNLGSASAYLKVSASEPNACAIGNSFSYRAHEDQILTEVRGVRLSSITSPSRTVRFIATTDRIDLDQPADLVTLGLKNETGGKARRLESMVIEGKVGGCLQRWDFQYSHFVSSFAGFSPRESSLIVDDANDRYPDQYRLKLEAVRQESCDGAISLPYTFFYDENSLPRRKSHGQDYYGYNNGAVTNTSLVPRTMFNATNYLSFDCSDLSLFGERRPDTTAMHAGMLTDIAFPTGGKTTFVYEPHDVFGARTFEQREIVFVERNNCSHPYDCTPTCTGDTELQVVSQTMPSDGQLTFHASVIRPLDDACTYEGNLTVQLFIHDPMDNPTVPTEEFIIVADQDYFTYTVMEDQIPVVQAGGTYTFRLKVLPSTDNNGVSSRAFLSMSMVRDVEVTEMTNHPVGGLRIKTIISDPQDGQPATKKFFTYRKAGATPYDTDTKSSGVLNGKPTLLQLTPGNIFMQEGQYNCGIPYYYLSGQTVVPLASSQGSHVTYERVEVSYLTNLNNGKSVYYYKTNLTQAEQNFVQNQFDPVFYLYNQHPAPPEIALPMDFGFLTGEAHFDRNGAVIRQSTTTYITEDQFNESFDHYVNVSGACACTAQGDCFAAYEGVPYEQGYTLNNGVVLTRERSETLDGITTTTTYEYSGEGDPGTRMPHLNPIADQMTNTDGVVYRSETDYPHERVAAGTTDAGIAQLLIDKHQIGLPIQTRQLAKTPGDPIFVLQTGLHQVFFNFGNDQCLPVRFEEIEYQGDPEVNRFVRTEVFGYNAQGLPTASQYMDFHRETYEWTDDGLLERKTYGDVPNNDFWEWNFTYENDSRLLQSATAIDGQVETFTYDGLQRKETGVARNGAITQTYGYQYRSEAGNNKITTQTIYADGTPTQTVEMEADGLGRETRTRLNGVVKNEIIYNELGLIERQTYLPGNFTTLRYEPSPLNRLQIENFPDGYARLTGYGSENGYNRTRVTDENGHNTTTLTDKLGRTISVENAIGGKTTYEYNPRGGVVEIVPPLADSLLSSNSNFDVSELIFEFDYDERNRRQYARIPGAGQKDFTYYDATDLVLTETDANDNLLTYYYDKFGRETERTLTQNNVTATILKNRFDNDFGNIANPPTDPINVGKLNHNEVLILEQNLSSSNKLLTSDFSYDSYGRLQTTTSDNHIAVNGGLGSETITTSYNDADWTTQVNRNHVGYESLNIIQSWQHDNFGRIIQSAFSVNNDGTVICQQGWNNRDQLTRKLLGQNLQSLDYLYNERGWLRRINQPIMFPEEDTGAEPNDPCGGGATLANASAPLMSMTPEMFCGQNEIDLHALLQSRFDDNVSFDCYNSCAITGGAQSNLDCPAQDQSNVIDETRNSYATTQTITCDDNTTQTIYAADVNSLNFPVTLYRVRVCGNEEFYVFQNELQYINGNYVQVQTIEVTHAEQLFTIQLPEGIELTINLSELLRLMIEGETFAANGYQTNDGSCSPTAPENCTPAEIDQQQLDFGNIENVGMRFDPEDIEPFLPAELLRIRLCDGTEVYLFDFELTQLSGSYNILQTITVTSADQTFDRGMNMTNLDLNDLFHLGLYYDDLPAEVSNSLAQHNGNISFMTWHVGNEPDALVQTYRYKYDAIDRVQSAYYANPDANFDLVNNNFYSSNYSYDGSGNILSLNRRKPNGSSCGMLMDELDYTYHYASAGNRLVNVVDGTSDDLGFKNGAGTYTYDDNGNLKIDPKKGLTFRYNHLNLPRQVYKSSSNPLQQILWRYAADGRKLSKAILGTTNDYTKDYCDGIEYKDGIIEAIYHDEGRFVPDGSGGFEEEFTIKDHLGNTRVVFADLDGNGKIEEETEILETEDYYAFGLGFSAVGSVGTEYPYLYNGKELDGELGLKWFDYGARFYDPAIARFTSIDPMSEAIPEWSAYHYTFNNPISFNDPTGMMGEDVIATTVVNKDDPTQTYYIDDGYDFVWEVSGDDFNRIKGNGRIPDDLHGVWTKEFYWQVWQALISSDGSASDEITQFLITDNIEPVVDAMANKNPKALLGIASGKLKKLKKLARWVRGKGNRTKKIPGTARGGKTFENDGRDGGQVLPKKDANGKPITYTKYDVSPAPQHGATRGKERMVVGSDGRAYYTKDHYKTFEEFKY